MSAAIYKGVGILALGLSAAPAAAAPDQAASAYRQLFPKSTGQNGYEELILAGETAGASRVFLRAESPRTADAEGKSLAFKRRTLADPPVAKALALVRLGLAKPMVPLRRAERPGWGSMQSLPLRRVLRLLALQQYVLLADGRVPEAVVVAQQGLRIGRTLYLEPQITGLLGLNLATGSLGTLAAHLDQLSARDCETLYQACVEWLRLPDPQAAEMEEERRQVPALVASMRAAIAKEGLPALEKLQVYEEEIPEPVKRALEGSPAALDALYRQVERRFEAIYLQQQAQLRKPPWERSWELPPDDGSPAARLAALVHSPYDAVSDGYTRGAAYLQLFACHCAVRRYRWEHNRLPVGLAELGLGDLAVDPFTGKLFAYEARGRTYRLTSAGPAAEEDDAAAVDGRLPFSIVPGAP
jgi:hypothetical protein